MRNAKAFLCLTVLCLTAFPAVAASPDTPQRGVEPSDIDRSVDPCVDFYAYANGSWRANNPIPASMPRWSRRWAAGESTKDSLRQILDQVTADPKQPKGSVEQLIGDF
jgi:putative endopeptidase